MSSELENSPATSGDTTDIQLADVPATDALSGEPRVADAFTADVSAEEIPAADDASTEVPPDARPGVEALAPDVVHPEEHPPEIHSPEIHPAEPSLTDESAAAIPQIIPDYAPASLPMARARWGTGRLRWWDYLSLAAFCLLLFGYYMVCGRPLSMHEARVPQTAREMLQNASVQSASPMAIADNWLFPKSGGRPWLERPPLPHWIMIGTSLILGQRCDTEWIVRLPSVILGTLVVLLSAWMASVWFGRSVGLLSGFMLATMYEFYTYSILAEDEIYLAALVTLAMALFVHLEFASGRQWDRRVTFLGNRPWQVWGLFIVLGLSNLVKSPLLGVVVVAGPIGVFLLLNMQWPRLRRYVWETGWILCIVLSAPGRWGPSMRIRM